MKKLILALAFALMSVFASYAGEDTGLALTVRTGIKAYLTNQGYVPSIDNDNDISFKAEGRSYYISCVNFGSDVYIDFYTLLSVEGSNMANVRVAADEAQKSLKMLRIDVLQSNLSIGVVMLVSKASDFNKHFSDLLDIIMTGRTRVLDNYSE